MLDAGFKRKWVKALRSGKYVQGTGSLRTEDDKYCCLGVACEVLGVPILGLEKCVEDPDKNRFIFGSDINGSRATSIVKEYSEPVGLYLAVQSELWRMNDQDGKSFNEIATYIEENL